jgi:hypothetical protein
VVDLTGLMEQVADPLGTFVHARNLRRTRHEPTIGARRPLPYADPRPRLLPPLHDEHWSAGARAARSRYSDSSKGAGGCGLGARWRLPASAGSSTVDLPLRGVRSGRVRAQRGHARILAEAFTDRRGVGRRLERARSPSNSAPATASVGRGTWVRIRSIDAGGCGRTILAAESAAVPRSRGGKLETAADDTCHGGRARGHSGALRRSVETRCRVTPKRSAICSIVRPSA